VIPEAAVEAAAKVTFEGLYDDEVWEDEPPAGRLPYLNQARAALEAAAPHIAAGAWHRGYVAALDGQVPPEAPRQYWVMLDRGSYKQFPTLEAASAEMERARSRGIHCTLLDEEPAK